MGRDPGANPGRRTNFMANEEDENYWHMSVVLQYEGKKYWIEDDNYWQQGGCFWWDDGNGGCDCNRSLFIQRQCDPKFPKFECGNKIEMLYCRQLWKYRAAPQLVKGVGWVSAIR